MSARTRARWSLAVAAAIAVACGQAPASEPRRGAAPIGEGPAREGPAREGPAREGPAPIGEGPAREGPAVAVAEAGSPYASLAGVEYVEVITGGARAEEALPLVIAIHGLGDRPERFAGVLHGLRAPARVILPRAFDASGDGFSWFPVRARSKDVEGLAAGIAAATERLGPFVAALPAARPTIGRPIVTGFSQGGMLSFAFAVRYPREVAAALPIAGWLPPPLWPSQRPVEPRLPSITAFHGDADAVVRIEPTRAAVAHLQGLGYPVTLREHAGVAHEVPAAIRRELYEGIEAAIAAQEAAP